MAKAWRSGDRSCNTKLLSFQPHSEQSAHLEMTRQERPLAGLLEQAFRIKEDIVGSLHATQESVLMEASARKLLENHIQVITYIVKQLSKDIQVLEAQIVQRDSVTSGTSFALQSLDHKNLAGIGDLRGRVARCDASTVKLSGDMKAQGQEILKLQQEVGGIRAWIELRLRDMELKISQSLGRLEVSLTQQVANEKNNTGDLKQHIQQLDIKTSSELRQLEGEVTRLRRWTEHQQNCTAQTHTENNQQLDTLLFDRVAEVEGKLKALLNHLSDRLERVEKRLEKERPVDRARRSESKINTRIDAVEKSLGDEIVQMRSEYQSGFQCLHDAIASLKHIGEAQAKLHKAELKKDIRRMERSLGRAQDV